MPWTTLKHDCPHPTTSDVTKAGAQPGSVWECECGKRWTLLGRDTNGSPLNVHKWEPAGERDTDTRTPVTENQ